MAQLKKPKINDVTKTGPQSYRELQAANEEAFTRASSVSPFAGLRQSGYVSSKDLIYEGPEYSPLYQQTGGTDYWGNSMFDDDFANEEDYSRLSDVRAKNQPLCAKAAAGIIKGAILAGTTFLDGTIGLLAGIGQAVYNAASDDKDKHWYEGFWDNPITNLMGLINEASEEALPNYRTLAEQEAPWYSLDNLFSANFIFDTVVKNMGFTVGAAFSGGVYTKAISWGAKAIGLAKAAETAAATVEAGEKAMQAANATRATKALVGSFFSAHAEAVQEAYNSSQDFIKTRGQEIDSRAAEQQDLALQEFVQNGGSLMMDGTPDPNSDPKALEVLNKKLEQIDQASAAAKQEAVKQSKNVGTMDGLLNIPVLWLDNIVMFGKMYAGGWKSDRNAHRTITRATKEALKEAKAAAKAGDPTKLNQLKELVVKAEQTGYQGLTEAEKAMVEEVSSHVLGPKMGATWAAIKGPLREGNEEMLQGAASQAANYKYSGEVDRIFDSKLNIESQDKVKGTLESILYGMQSQYGDIDNYEEAFIGAITGLLGSPTFGKRNNSSDQTYLGKSKWIGLTGGTFTEVRDYLRNRRVSDEAAQHATEVLRSGALADNIKHLIAQTHFNDTMDRAIIHDDEKEYKDARTASTFEMISHLKRVDRLDLLLRAMQATTEFSDEDIAEIAESVSKQVSATTPDVQEKIQQRNRVEKEIETMLESYEDLYTEAYETGNSEKIDAVDEMLKQKRAELASLDAEIKKAKPVSISPYIHKDGTAFTTEEIKEDIDKRVQHFQKIIDTIALALDLIDLATSESLTNEQLDTLTWYKVMMDDWNERASGITEQWKEVIDRLASDPTLVQSLEAIQDVEDLLEEAGFDPSKAGVQLGGRFDSLRKIKNYGKILEQLQEAVNSGGMNLAYLLTSTLKPKGSEETVGDIISKHFERVLQADTNTSKDIKDAFLKNLNDLKSIGKGHRRYNELLDEYLKNPERIDQAHQASTNNALQESARRSNSATAAGVNWNSPAGTIAKYLRDHASEIQAAGGFEQFISNLTPEQQLKAREAQMLVMSLDSLDNLIDSAGLEDEQARILRGIVEEAIDESDTIQLLANSVKDSIQQGTVEDLIRLSVPEEQPEDLTLRLIEAAEVALNEFLDDNIEKLAKSSEEAQRAVDAEQERVRQLANQVEDSQDDKVVGEQARGAQRAEEASLDEPSEDSLEEPTDAPVINPTTPTSAKKANKSIKRPQAGQPGYNRRRQVSQYYLNGEDRETLPQHYEQHPEDIPAGVDKEAFLRYIKAVHKKLVESGAYTYVSGVNPDYKLSKGDVIEFTTDKKLNEEAGVTVILMQVTNKDGNKQIIGSLPTSLDFQAKQRGSNKTGAEVHPEDKALYDSLCDELLSSKEVSETKEEIEFNSIKEGDLIEVSYKDYPGEGIKSYTVIRELEAGKFEVQDGFGNRTMLTEKNLNENAKATITRKSKVQQTKSSVSSITTKVEALMGGHPSFSSLNRSVAEVFGDTEVPITVISGNSRTSGAVKNPMDLIDPINGLVYVYVTANTGAQVPLLCFSTPLKDLASNDWYIQQTVAAIQKLQDAANIGSTKAEILKWLPFLTNLHINILENNGLKYLLFGWGENKAGRIANTHSIKLQSDGSISSKDAEKFVSTVARRQITLPTGEKMYPTTNIDHNRLRDKEYMSNATRYIKINVTSDSPRTIDDWFTYEPTSIQKSGKKPSLTNPAVVPSGKLSPEVSIETEGLTDSEKEAILDETPASSPTVDAKDNLDNPSDTSLEGLFGSDTSSIDMPDTPRRRRRKPKALLVSDTTDTAATERQLSEDVEKLSSMFPKLAEQGRIVVVRGLIDMVNKEGNPVKAYGLFKNGVLYVSDLSPKGTAFHEAFHYIADTLLSASEKIVMFLEASQLFGNLPEIELEEHLSEAFREFMNERLDTSIKGRLKNIFLNLKYIVLSLVGREPYLDGLFWSIYRNKLLYKTEDNSQFELELLEYKTKKLQYSNLDQATKEYLEARKFTEENYEKLSVELKELLLQCM